MDQKVSDKNKDFFKMVFDVVRLVPRGKVTTYGAIANYFGVKGGARMVGWAMNASHNQSEDVPAHRVVNRIGILTGKHHFNPPSIMEKTLKEEGVEVENDQILDFESKFWDPSLELKL